MILARTLAIAAATLSSGAPLHAARDKPVSVTVDHHVHVRSPAIQAILPAYCASAGKSSFCDNALAGSPSVTDLMRDMDAAGIRRARLMSTAYQAESPIMNPPLPDHVEIVRSANDFTVALARAQPDRFEAYIAVNPVTSTALPEIARWRGNRDVAGLKLHLANSRFDYHNPDHVKALADVFRAAASAHLRIMAHIRQAATGYGAVEARIFLNEILPAARGTTVQLAHIAGWGNIDKPTLDALGVFADACERDRKLCSNLYFDLAAVDPAISSDDQKTALVRLMRRIGLGHFVPASDWPVTRDLAAYYAALATLPLTPAEWKRIAHNVGR
jgi:predicted TIM-barrel fold metal-dependent hydrolase